MTLETLHADLTAGFAEMRAGFADLKGEMRTGFADLKATLIAGFRGLPGREASEEMIRLLREGNRMHDERFTQIDLRLREQHLESQQVLHALVEGQRVLIESNRDLLTPQGFARVYRASRQPVAERPACGVHFPSIQPWHVA